MGLAVLVVSQAFCEPMISRPMQIICAIADLARHALQRPDGDLRGLFLTPMCAMARTRAIAASIISG
jgi:hypothetical protein